MLSRSVSLSNRPFHSPLITPKKLSMKNISLYLLLCACVLRVSAQTLPQFQRRDTSTLEWCIKMARATHPSLRAADAQRRMQLLMEGTVSVIGRTDVSTMLGQYNSMYFDANVGVNQQFVNPLLVRAQRKVYAQEYERANQQYLLADRELVRQVRSSFFTWAVQHERLKLFRAQDSLLTEMEHIAASRLKTGEGNSLAVLNVQLRRAELRRQIQLTRQDSAVVQMRLRLLIGSNEPLVLASNTLWRMPLSPLGHASLNSHPMQQAQNSAVRAAEAQVGVANARTKPDFSLGYFNQSLTAPRDGVSPLARFSYLQATVSLPLYRKPYRIAAEAAAATAEQARFEADALQKNIFNTHREAIFRQENAAYLVEEFERESLPQSQQLIELARKNYLAAEISYVEYMQSIESAYATRLSYLNARDTLNQAAVEAAYWSN